MGVNMNGRPIPTVPFAPRELNQDIDQDIATEVENNIRKLRAQDSAPIPSSALAQVDYRKRSALELIAGAFQTLTYGEMMQISNELKIITGDTLTSTTPADIAALL